MKSNLTTKSKMSFQNASSHHLHLHDKISYFKSLQIYNAH